MSSEFSALSRCLLQMFKCTFIISLYDNVAQRPAQIAESVNDSANSLLVMGSIPTVSTWKKIIATDIKMLIDYFILR